LKIALLPQSVTAYRQAIESAGGEVASLGPDVNALVWTDYSQPTLLAETLENNPQLQWVQLPFAGVDAFSSVLQKQLRFTSAKGAYAQPVAEHALALCLALGRAIPERVKATSWGEKFAVSLYESRVLIVGGGGIAQELVRLLAPFGCPITVIRRNPHLELGSTTYGFEHLDDELPKADFVIIAFALTSETIGLFNQRRFALMKPSAYLVNIARGKHVVTEDLVEALNAGVIAGAAVDVTDPEPLPNGHPLWSAKNCIVTPHTADTPEQVTRMLAERIYRNVLAFRGEGDWVGLVDPTAGY
jgi:phosphoglycerate dehydrogenase-like enzyme